VPEPEQNSYEGAAVAKQQRPANHNEHGNAPAANDLGDVARPPLGQGVVGMEYNASRHMEQNHGCGCADAQKLKLDLEFLCAGHLQKDSS